MRELTFSETSSASAGMNAIAVATGIFLTTVTLGLIFSERKPNCYWKPYLKEVKTPIYDSYGNHVYDNVDTYEDYVWTCS